MPSLRWSLIFLVSALVSCKDKPETKETKVEDKRAPVCATFEGGKLSAVWSGCPDKIRREVKCATFIDDLKCDCLEDGVQRWFFTAKDPPLTTRADATRVANTNCKWALETPP